MGPGNGPRRGKGRGRGGGRGHGHGHDGGHGGGLHECRCDPPPAPGGPSAAPGGGSGEILLTWDPLPDDEEVRHYRVYRQKGEGRWWLLAVVAADAQDAEGRVFVVDAPDYWPWPQGLDPAAERCYTVSAVSEDGLEGPMSAPACAVPL